MYSRDLQLLMEHFLIPSLHKNKSSRFLSFIQVLLFLFIPVKKTHWFLGLILGFKHSMLAKHETK